MKNSTLMLASFEMTTDHLYEAAVHCRKDEIKGVSECIIMGNMMPVGTGIFKLVYDESYHKNAEKESIIIDGGENEMVAFDSVQDIIKDKALMINK
jgi:DNA-directed RNA polymerase III subunit RPC1